MTKQKMIKAHRSEPKPKHQLNNTTNHRITQGDRLIRYMANHKGITSMQAFDKFGITRLSARIFELRNNGYDIVANQIAVKNRYGESVTCCRYELRGERVV